MLVACPLHGLIDWPVTSILCPLDGCQHELVACRDQVDVLLAMAEETPPMPNHAQARLENE